MAKKPVKRGRFSTDRRTKKAAGAKVRSGERMEELGMGKLSKFNGA
jgi:hypothetical protein